MRKHNKRQMFTHSDVLSFKAAIHWHDPWRTISVVELILVHVCSSALPLRKRGDFCCIVLKWQLQFLWHGACHRSAAFFALKYTQCRRCARRETNTWTLGLNSPRSYVPWFLFSLRRVSIICPIIVLKIAVTAFPGVYFHRSKWPNWLKFFQPIWKIFRSVTEKKT